MEVNGKKVKLSIWVCALGCVTSNELNLRSGYSRTRTFSDNYIIVLSRSPRNNSWYCTSCSSWVSILTTRSILVYDVSNRESFEALPRWYSELETYVSSSVVKILVGNKVDKVINIYISWSWFRSEFDFFFGRNFQDRYQLLKPNNLLHGCLLYSLRPQPRLQSVWKKFSRRWLRRFWIRRSFGRAENQWVRPVVGVVCLEVCRLLACEMTQDRSWKKVVVLADAYIPQHSIMVLGLHSLPYSTDLYLDLALHPRCRWQRK